MTDHPMVGAHASSGHVPPSLEDLERLDVEETGLRQSEDELLDLDRRRKVGTENRA